MANDGWPGRFRRAAVTARMAVRAVDPRPRAEPDFVVIGAQRAGTTTLYAHLVQHPQVRPPLRKEIQYLSLHWQRGAHWYRRHFPVVRDVRLRTCEASPYYLFHPNAPERAASALPTTRFIALLREPVARARSHHRHNQANGLEPLDFEDALAAEPERLAHDPSGRHHRLYSYMGRGFYAEQLRRWRGAVGDRLLVLLSEDLFNEPRQTLDRVQAFVGLDPWEPDGFHVYATHPSTGQSPIAPATRRRLQERFAAPNRELEALIGRDLSAWSDGIDAPWSRWPTESPQAR